jgi:hypothetical protein
MATRVLTKTVSPSDTTDDSSASPSSSPAATSEDGAPGSRNAGKVAGIVAGAVGGSAAIAAAIWYLLRKRDGCALEQARARSPSFITPTPMEEKFKNNSWFNRSGERQSWRRFKPGRGDARLSSEDGLPRHRADGAGAPATYTNRSSRYYSNTGRTNVPDVSAVEFCEDSPSFRSALPYAQRESNGMNLETLNSPASQKDRFSHMPPNFPTSRYQVDSRLDPLPPLPSSHDRMISAPSPALIRPTV